MARFPVVWDPDVEAAFINHWIGGDSQTRARLTEVARWIDSNLSQNPADQGRARPDLSARIVAVPLADSSARVAATIEIYPEDYIVRGIRLTFRGE